jgi:hypothetical protein
MRIKAALLILAGSLFPAVAAAQVNVQVVLPTLRFETPPPLVVVSPGVQVVPDYDEEVFVSDGWYWYRANGYWYRARDYRGGWVVVDRQYVPQRLTRFPPGHYKHHHGNGRRMHGYDRDRGVSEVRFKDKHEEKRERKEKNHDKRGKGR